MPTNAPPASIRDGLRATAKALSGVSPNVGLGSRQALPYEDPTKPGAWAGESQLTGIKVKWDDTFRISRGETKADDKTTPAASVQLEFVTKLEDGQACSWSTRPYRWVYGDPSSVLPDSKGDYIRRRARDDQAIIMGWFQALLGVGPGDPIIRELDKCVEAVDVMLETARSQSQPVLVKAGWVKTDDSYVDKRTKKEIKRFNIEHFVYKNYFGQEPGTEPA